MLPRALLAAALVASPATAGAQGWIEPEGRGATAGVARVASSVRIRLDGRIARYEVEELFRNDTPRVAEGSYLYPMPGEAVFTDFSLFQGDLELKGEMLNAAKARAIYEEIVRKRRDPALLTLAGNGLVRAQVFPIEPGQTRKVILRYTQVLERDDAAFRLRYPLGARVGGEIDLVIRAADSRRFGRPYSPTHEARTTHEGREQVTRIHARPAGELELFFPLRSGAVGTTVVTHAPGGRDRHFMLVLSPPAGESVAPLSRDLTLVVDVSGSMAGAKLEQAKAALLQALGSLGPRDRFRIVAFANGVTEFRDGWSPATRPFLAEGREFIDRLAARGGTNIAEALRTVLEADDRRGRLRQVIFLTDGLPSVGEQSPERIAAAAAARRGGARIFPIGVGHDVNTYLLDRLAVEGRGRVEYVGPGANVETAVGAVLRRLDAPVLMNLRLVSAPVELLDVAPAELPDLYAGEDLVLFGRYEGTGSGDVVLEGERDGRRHRFATRAVFPRHQPDHDYIPALWAARRIGELTRQARLEGQTPALIAQIRDLGLRYGILTEYTSYLVLEPEAVIASGELRLEELRVNAATPSSQVGQEAFERAARSAELAAAKSLASLDDAREDQLAAVGASAGERRRAGGRLFVQRLGVWTDLAHADSLPVTAVAPFSEAYFALVRALPELADWLAVGDNVIVAGRAASIRLEAGGTAAWRAGELERLVARFRGQ